MFFLADFSPIIPDVGFVLWTTVIFALVFLVLRKTAFGAISEALNEREKSINDALAAADKARSEMQNLHAQNEALLKEAREERAAMLNEAKTMKEKILAEAKATADAEFKRKVDTAMVEINTRKNDMLNSVKADAGKMAIEIAEKIIRKELKGNAEHESLVSELSKQFNKN